MLPETARKSTYQAGCYARLSREDGDRPESDSILNQRRILADFCTRHPEFTAAGEYTDDGYTGTSFDRPAFKRMIADIEAGKVTCVLVKDLSRFGRDYIDMGYYLERWFPAHGVRFIAINDGVDSDNGYDLLLPVKNVFNAQYARDISGKIRSAFHAKQTRGEFIGAFASYGYVKDPDDSDKLLIDPPAAQVVRRIYGLFDSGMGKISIARLLNQSAIPCPSVYKQQMGLKYSNGRRLQSTSYWTYATVNRLLRNPVYAGDMAQARSVRPTMHARARSVRKEDWVLVRSTHEAIIPRDQWDRVQRLLDKRGRAPDLSQNISLFAGFLKCGDCGRAMAKTERRYNGQRCITYSCGSYKRYGSGVCTPHSIRQEVLEQLILADLNAVISSVANLRKLAKQFSAPPSPPESGGLEALRRSLDRVFRLKKGTYEDYKEGLLSKEDYLAFRSGYEQQETSLKCQLADLEKQATARKSDRPYSPWVDRLLALGRLEQLDRPTLAETVREVRVFEDHRLEITYLFSEELEALLNPGGLQTAKRPP